MPLCKPSASSEINPIQDNLYLALLGSPEGTRSGCEEHLSQAAGLQEVH